LLFWIVNVVSGAQARGDYRQARVTIRRWRCVVCLTSKYTYSRQKKAES
jgi:hypothetical protein